MPVEEGQDFEGRFALGDAAFEEVRGVLHREAGIKLADSKRDLVQGRLSRRIRACGCDGFAQYLDMVRGPGGEAEHRQMINALTTNLTDFFRESHHFDHLGTELLPQLLQERRGGERRLRLWSAGCSSGEEPYSIAMVLAARVLDLAAWDARILATDLDTNMVAHGRAGVYEAARAERVPNRLRHRFLEPAGPEHVQVTEELRRLVAFKPLNLLEPWPMRGPFDAIFCRNVVIYFDKPTQRRLFDRFADMLTPGGCLFIGHSESLFRVCDRFEHLGRTIYRRLA